MNSKIFKSIVLTPIFCLFTALAIASHPLTVVSWDAFTDADSYEVQVKTSGGSVVAGPTTNLDTDVVLGDLMTGLSAGSYQFEVRAKVGSYFTDWNTPTSFSFVLEVPGTVTGVTFTD
jgi:hypothetical protein